jgi:hypothetical protein
MLYVRWVLVFVACAAAGSGCGGLYTSDADRFVNLTDGQGYDRGLVICLSGAGGITGEVGRIRQGLIEGGVQCAIESFEWSSGMVLVDQVDLDSNKTKARALACRIEAYGRDHPGCPVHMIGVSAGTGLIVWALEDLNSLDPVENVVLLGSSLGGTYNLKTALGHINGRLHNHYSGSDMVLGLLVRATGTVDRGDSDAGGLRGFRPPVMDNEETRTLYDEKLTQVAWTAEDASLGNLGDHLGGTNPTYVKARLAQLCTARTTEPPTETNEPPALSVAAADRN